MGIKVAGINRNRDVFCFEKARKRREWNWDGD